MAGEHSGGGQLSGVFCAGGGGTDCNSNSDDDAGEVVVIAAVTPPPPPPEPEPVPKIAPTSQNIQRGIEVVNGAAVGELELDISCVVFAMNEWSKNWSANHRPNSDEVKKASVKLLELTGDRNSISNLPQYASILVALKVLDLSGCSGISGTFR